MAIEFNCPHCNLPYKLKDEFAGRKATCKNPDCRQQITIPKPPSAAELEAAALSVLADEAPKVADTATATAEKVIAITCTTCDHKWTEPISKAGKNVLCPECRTRTRVPEPKDDTPLDWRQAKSKLPTLAKQNVEKPSDVQDAADVKYVRAESLQQADATGIEYEPRPLKQKIMFVLLPLLLIGAIGYGGWYLSRRSTSNQENKLMAEALVQVQEKDAFKELPAPQQGLFTAMLHGAAAEYTLRLNDSKKLKEAHDQFVKAAIARDAAKVPPGPERNAILAELAALAVAFGGNDDQVREQTRYRWVPDINAQNVRSAERPRTIHAELNAALNPLQQVPDSDFKAAVARRLTRDLCAKEQAEFAADYLPMFLFTENEKDEARALIALEIYRAEKGSPIPGRIAADLKGKGVKATTNGSAQILFSVTGQDRLPDAPAVLPSESTRLAHVGRLLLEENAPEALRVATRPGGTAEHQFKALALCAEWSRDPGPAIDSALDLISTTKSNPNVKLSQSLILRFSQLASGAGKHEQSKKMSEWLTDEGQKVWARGDAVRYRTLANPTEKADEAWVELPTTSDKLRAGHAWGRFWIARQNARVSGDWKAEKKITDLWSFSPIQPFALAGLALGLKDR